MCKRMSLTSRLGPDNLWITSVWVTVLLLRPIWAGEGNTKKKDIALNPHGDSGRCSLCHTSPAGGRAALQFDGSVSRLCQSCHDGRRAQREAHEVDVAPGPAIALRIPREFPLERGRLTCLSCHDMALLCNAERGAAAANRNFLGGRPS